MTKFWAAGLVIEMEADERGVPLRFVWDGTAHPVTVVAERWRLDGFWWSGRIWREYFKLATATGLLAVVFHDLTTGRWYVQRLYD